MKGGARPAQAEVEASVAAYTGIATGDIGVDGTPPAGGAVQLRWQPSWTRFSIGVQAGQHMQNVAGGDELATFQTDTLTLRTFGGQIRYSFADIADIAAPYLAINGGAIMASTGQPLFHDPAGGNTTSSMGFYVAPEIGIKVGISKHVGLGIAMRYEYALAANAMTIATDRAQDLSSVGFNWSIYFSL